MLIILCIGCWISSNSWAMRHGTTQKAQRVTVSLYTVGKCRKNMLFYADRWWTFFYHALNVLFYFPRSRSVDTATRYVSQNLVNCINKLYNKSTTSRSDGVTVLQLIDLQWTATTRRLSYRCRQQARPSTTTTSFVDNAIDLSWRNFLNPEFGFWSLGTSQREVSKFLEILKFSCTTVRNRWKQTPCQKQLDSSSRLDTVPACDKRTDGHAMTAYTALA